MTRQPVLLERRMVSRGQGNIELMALPDLGQHEVQNSTLADLVVQSGNLDTVSQVNAA